MCLTQTHTAACQVCPWDSLATIPEWLPFLQGSFLSQGSTQVLYRRQTLPFELICPWTGTGYHDCLVLRPADFRAESPPGFLESPVCTWYTENCSAIMFHVSSRHTNLMRTDIHISYAFCLSAEPWSLCLMRLWPYSGGEQSCEIVESEVPNKLRLCRGSRLLLLRPSLQPQTLGRLHTWWQILPHSNMPRAKA